MPVDDALDGRQPNAGALKLFRPMQTLKYAKQLVDVLHLKACAVIGDEYLDLIVLPGGTANLDFGCARVRVNLTALDSRFARTSFSMERSP